jgi:hypothetical protein
MDGLPMKRSLAVMILAGATMTLLASRASSSETLFESAKRAEYSTDSLEPAGDHVGYALGNFATPEVEGPKRGPIVLLDYDAFRGISDGAWENNGINVGANYGTRLGAFSDASGIGLQVGSSIGIYNWSGTDYRLARHEEATVQGFFTYGLFHKAHEDSPWVAGLVQDWMFTSNFGVFAENLTLSQLRGQLGYVLTDTDELGLWGTCRVVEDTHNVPTFGSTTWRPVNQISSYWHHKWEQGADTTLSFGVPERDRITGDHSLGDYFVSAAANVAMNDRVSLYALVTYMSPSAGPGDAGAAEDQWNFTIGLAFYPRRNAVTNTVRGQRWTPLLPLANNGYFLVDTNRWF